MVHVSYSSQVAFWRYDAIRKTVFLAMPRTSCAVEVCSIALPRYGAHPITRVDETTWRIAPVRYQGTSERNELVTRAYPVNVELGMEFVFLLDAPESVSLEFEALE